MIQFSTTVVYYRFDGLTAHLNTFGALDRKKSRYKTGSFLKSCCERGVGIPPCGGIADASRINRCALRRGKIEPLAVIKSLSHTAAIERIEIFGRPMEDDFRLPIFVHHLCREILHPFGTHPFKKLFYRPGVASRSPAPSGASRRRPQIRLVWWMHPTRKLARCQTGRFLFERRRGGKSAVRS